MAKLLVHEANAPPFQYELELQKKSITRADTVEKVRVIKYLMIEIHQ